METHNFKPRQKVWVMIFGCLRGVEIYSTDNRYIYFTDPEDSNDSLNKHRLFARKINTDLILTEYPKNDNYENL
jgi:hypothetical protein